MAEEKKCLVQEMHISCLAQLVAFEPGRAAMLEDSNVLEAVRVVAEGGLSSVARELGQSVLLAMSDRHAEPAVPNSPRRAHIMLSYQWDSQVKSPACERIRRWALVSHRRCLCRSRP